MKSFQLIAFLSICSVSNLQAQDQLYWNQYSALNPAATGTTNDLDVSSITSYYGNKVGRERLNADVRIRKIHGAVGVGYRYTLSQSFGTYQVNNPYLNYSFHIKTGENSLLAIGAGVSWADFRTRYQQEYGGGFFHRQSASYNLGAHFQYKRLKVGATLSTFEDYERTQIELSNIYADYTFVLGENWQLHTAAYLGDSRINFNNRTILARAIYKNRYWFGSSLSYGHEVGFMAGINLNDRWSIGYSMGVHFSNGLAGNHIENQNLLVRFQMPWK